MPRFSLPIMGLFDDPVGFLKNLAISAPAILIALVLHEVAHGLVAYWCGDNTAKRMGRLSLNPARHLDPVGTALLVLVGFGYARPVPVNPRNFRHGRRDDFFVSIAGITMNLILFLLFGSAFIIYLACSPSYNEYIYFFLYYCATINASLAVFNLFPLPPLDGYHVVNDLLLKRPLFADANTTRIAQGILFVLIMTRIVDKIISFCLDGLWNGLLAVWSRVLV